LRLDAQLDPTVSRWRWLVKPVLVIPHAVVLAALWVGAFLATIAAGVAILVTGRYPRPIFEFTVGVLRWTWRVSFYTTGAFGTDRYPPFSLRRDANYPGDLDVVYPESLSRWLVLVKWWLLVIPQYFVVAALAGGWGAGSIGLITVLALVAAVQLMFRGRYPEELFGLLIGLNRWCFRVAAYAFLLTDRYPPFRLDTGGTDPAAVMVGVVDTDRAPHTASA
jgi:hypothetical protein